MANASWFAVYWQETGEEGIIHPQKKVDGTFETVEEVKQKAPEEWQFRHIEEVKDYHQLAQSRMDEEDGIFEPEDALENSVPYFRG